MYQSGLWEAGYGVVRVGTGGDAWWILRWISSLHGMARDGFWWFQRCFMDVHELWDVILASQWRTQSMSYGRWWNCTASTTKQVYCKHHGIIMGIMVVFFKILGILGDHIRLGFRECCDCDLVRKSWNTVTPLENLGRKKWDFIKSPWWWKRLWSSFLGVMVIHFNLGGLEDEWGEPHDRKETSKSICICIIELYIYIYIIYIYIFIHVYIVLNDYCIFYRYECPSESLSLPNCMCVKYIPIKL